MERVGMIFFCIHRDDWGHCGLKSGIWTYIRSKYIVLNFAHFSIDEHCMAHIVCNYPAS